MLSPNKKNPYVGIALAVIATLIWAGNFVIARGVIKTIPPVSLSFYRWVTAAVIMLPFAFKHLRTEWPAVKSSWAYLFWVSLSGIALFNTFVYIGAHYTSAINLALIGTVSSPVIAVALARIFLKERIGLLKLASLAICICAVLVLLSQGNIHNLLHFRFTAGDGWILAAATAFAVYNTLVKKKPASISTTNFLFFAFSFGAILLLPFYLWETGHAPAVEWNLYLLLIILYLGVGASVICFFCWNIAIAKLGAGRTALFGNLIPVFSTIEAAIILNENFTWVHVVSMLMVFVGILLANLKRV